jgi:hypothetical protein
MLINPLHDACALVVTVAYIHDFARVAKHA